MKPFDAFDTRPIDLRYHTGDGGFREQMSVLRVAGDYGDKIKMVRSFLTVGSAAMSGFDPDHPDEDTVEGWKVLDGLIENQNVRGTFHTHPPNMNDFSSKDWSSIEALAKANGMMPIWHGVQAVNDSVSHFVCARMIKGHVQIYDLGWYNVPINDPVIILPLPPRIDFIGNMSVLALEGPENYGA